MKSQCKPDIKLGYYRHFKGVVYEVFALGRESENQRWMVVYKDDQQENHIRYADHFASVVEVDGFETNRFEYLGQVKP